MEKYLNTGIKQVIIEFQQVGELLEHFGIGCVTCSVGTCLLKDIIEIHSLPKQKELEVMIKIEKIIYPGRESAIPEILVDSEPIAKKEVRFSPPIKKLVDEHVNIKAVLAKIPKICEVINNEEKINEQLVLSIIDFIKSYADKYHHAKEEDILFKYANENSEIIQIMMQDHITGRNFVKSVLEGLESGDKNKIINGLKSYTELLVQHIKKEDEVLYPWFEKNLSLNQIGELYHRFNDADLVLGSEVSTKYELYINNLKEELK